MTALGRELASADDGDYIKVGLVALSDMANVRPDDQTVAEIAVPDAAWHLMRRDPTARILKRATFEAFRPI